MAMSGKHANISEFGRRDKEEEAVIKVLVPILDGLILVTGLLGQILVIITLTGRRRKDHHPPHGTDTLLLALSAADLLLLLCLPFHTSAITLGFWPFGSFLCKSVSFLGVACSSASVFTLAALAVTRYLTVVHPTWAYRWRMHCRVKVMVALLWLPASALAAPQFAFRTVTTSRAVYCFAFLSDFSQLVYSMGLFFFGFALPLGIIVLMYAKIYCFLRHARLFGNAPQLERYQSQVTHTSALLVLVFTLLWLPSYALMFSFIGGTIQGSKGYNTIAILARLLASSVAVVNPVLYGFMSQKFRKELLKLGRERWTFCKNSLLGCPHMMMGGDIVQSFDLDTSSET
ncbi:galanin receptor type 1-like [Corythoichthys intestinalis]|uniref:galanin receptor type 1-like n=1 Tax=Corythoichthys intestinalis TaxID=161448 RepID=UPI0025A676B5|nr:galanin receptor type 1-like [Corythoichthys intestinalis]XP_061803059.1 galanin receptor type 1-like [Nerophis lumbriciformis]